MIVIKGLPLNGDVYDSFDISPVSTGCARSYSMPPSIIFNAVNSAAAPYLKRAKKDERDPGRGGFINLMLSREISLSMIKDNEIVQL